MKERGEGWYGDLHAFVRVLRWGVGRFDDLTRMGAEMPCTSVWYDGSLNFNAHHLARMPGRVDIDSTISELRGHTKWVCVVQPGRHARGVGERGCDRARVGRVDVIVRGDA